MLILIALVYLLLCLRLRVQIDVSIDRIQGDVALSVGAFGLSVRHEAEIVSKKNGVGFCLESRGKMGNKRKNPSTQKIIEQLIVPYFRDIVHRRRINRLTLCVHLGLGDACSTAIAVGGVYALFGILASAVVNPASCVMHVKPDFAKACFHVRGQGIFFCQLGDILLAAIQTAWKGRRNKGLLQEGIPVRT